jgi:hypothetical protein
MQSSSISLRLFVLIGCALLAVDGELTPFYNFRQNSSNNDKDTLDLRSRARNLNGDYGAHGKQDGNYDYTVGRYGQKVYDEYDCESFYGKSHKNNKSAKKDNQKLHKYDKKKCKGYTPKPDYGEGAVDHMPPKPEENYKDFVRFIMVREEAGTPTPDNFGVGDTLALNGQIYYWEDYEDNLMSDLPVGNFVTLCTGISSGDDLMCTYEIVLGTMTHKNQNGNPIRGFASSVDGVGAFVANGPNYLGENQMIVTGTEFDLSKFTGGTLVTQEDLVNPYLYADLYLL